MDELDAAEPLVRVNSLADSVLQHTSSNGQSAIRHDLNNCSIEVERVKTEIKQKLKKLEELISKLHDCGIFYTDVSTSIKRAEDILNRNKAVPTQLEIADVMASLQVCYSTCIVLTND